MDIWVNDDELRGAAAEGMDAFVTVFLRAIHDAIGGELTAENMQQLNADQLTLLAWEALHGEVMDGGFVQLIHNGYGPFIFKNPFAKAVRLWGLRDLSKLVYEAHTLYVKHGDEITRDCTDEEFMAMFEQYPEFDELDDAFIEHEEEWTEQMARYIDEHVERFASIKH
ncbi:MAG: DMP19 family protein [Prevotella sp.]|nr:DMP19 family protein [Prevotella sp.]